MVAKTDIVKEISTCDECGSTDFVSDSKRGETICEICGLVIEERKIDGGPEWRSFADDDGKRIRTGAPLSFRFHDKGLTTQIGFDQRDASGNKLSPTGLNRAHRLRKWQKRINVNSSLERNLLIANNKIGKFVSQMKLPISIEEPTAQLYRRAAMANIPRGRSIENTVIACLLITCRELKIPRTIQDFAKVTRISYKVIGKYFRLVQRVLELTPKYLTPKTFLIPYCEKLRVPTEIRQCAIQLIEKLGETKCLISKDPNKITAACIYIAGKVVEQEVLLEKELLKKEGNATKLKEMNVKITQLKRDLRRVTQARISNVSGVSEVTIRNYYREFCQALDITIDN